MSKLSNAIFVRVIFLGIVAIFLIIKNKKTKKIKEKLKAFTFKDFQLFFERFMKYQFDTNYLGLQCDDYKVLYFVNHKNKINIEFELLHQEQITFYNNLLNYAKDKGYKTKRITYQHKINFNGKEEYAPVLQLLTNFTLEQAIIESQYIFKEVFNCSKNSTFDIIE